MFEALAHWLLRHRVLAGILLMLVFFSLVSGSTKLYADMNVEGFFLDAPEAKARFHSYQEQWGGDNDTVIIIAHTKEGMVATPTNLQLLQELLDELRGSDLVRRASGLPDFVRILSEDEDMVLKSVLETMPANTPPNSAEFTSWLTGLTTDTFLVPNLLSKDASNFSISPS